MQLQKYKADKKIDDLNNIMKELTYKMHYEDVLSDLGRAQKTLRETRSKNLELYEVLTLKQ